MKNYYQILDVKKNASASDIKKAYDQLSQINSQEEAHLRQLNEAYSVLNNPEKRRLYDIKIYQHTLCIMNDYVMKIFLFHADVQLKYNDLIDADQRKQMNKLTLKELLSPASKEHFESLFSTLDRSFYFELESTGSKELIKNHLELYLTQDEKHLAIESDIYSRALDALTQRVFDPYRTHNHILQFQEKNRLSKVFFTKIESTNYVDESKERFNALFDKNKDLMSQAGLRKQDFKEAFECWGWGRSFYWQMAETALLDLAQWHLDETYILNPREIFLAYLKRVVLNKLDERGAPMQLAAPILSFLMNLAEMMVQNKIPEVINTANIINTSHFTGPAINFFGDRWKGTDPKRLNQLISLRSCIDDIVFCLNDKWTFINPIFIDVLCSIRVVEFSLVHKGVTGNNTNPLVIEKLASALFDNPKGFIRQFKSEISTDITHGYAC